MPFEGERAQLLTFKCPRAWGALLSRLLLPGAGIRLQTPRGWKDRASDRELALLPNYRVCPIPSAAAGVPERRTCGSPASLPNKTGQT